MYIILSIPLGSSNNEITIRWLSIDIIVNDESIFLLHKKSKSEILYNVCELANLKVNSDSNYDEDGQNIYYYYITKNAKSQLTNLSEKLNDIFVETYYNTAKNLIIDKTYSNLYHYINNWSFEEKLEYLIEQKIINIDQNKMDNFNLLKNNLDK